MVTLRDVKKFLDDCENDYGITTGMYGNKLEIYRFDGEPIDDDVLIATVNERFDIEPSEGGFYPFNDGDGFIEDIENASVRDVVYAILGNMKMAIAEDMSVTHKTLDCIDDILKHLEEDCPRYYRLKDKIYSENLHNKLW